MIENAPDAMPADWQAGRTLSEDDLIEVRNCFTRMRGQLQFQYEREKTFGVQIAALEVALGEARIALRLNLQGYATQPEGVRGVWPDQWAGVELATSFVPTYGMHALRLEVWVPPQIAGAQQLRIELGDTQYLRRLGPGNTTIQLPLESAADQPVGLRIHASSSWTPSDGGDSADGRALAYLIRSVAIEHHPTTAKGGRAVLPVKLSHPAGHFYSPIVDPSQLDSDRLWPSHPEVLGIDFDDLGHERILRDIFPRFMADYDYPEHLDETPELTQFYTQNSQFTWLDARALFVLLREWKPQRFIEVGSGFSTLLAADINHRFLGDSVEITCIEPYPRVFLRQKIPGLTRLIQDKVQNVPLAEFTRLQAGDILFIDSSHVAKTGSDVNFLYFEVLPRLAPGVRIHIHDIFLPHEYQRAWVIDENRSWNEQYLLRALLMYSSGFRTVFGCSYAFTRYPELVIAALAHPQGHGFAGGSFWIERV